MLFYVYKIIDWSFWPVLALNKAVRVAGNRPRLQDATPIANVRTRTLWRKFEPRKSGQLLFYRPFDSSLLYGETFVSDAQIHPRALLIPVVNPFANRKDSPLRVATLRDSRNPRERGKHDAWRKKPRPRSPVLATLRGDDDRWNRGRERDLARTRSFIPAR